jgi:hypothetical protein
LAKYDSFKYSQDKYGNHPRQYIKQNLKEFALSGILRWHEAGYTGEGIKIAEIESAKPDLPFFDGKVHDPFGIGKDSKLNSHGQKVLDVIHQVAPDADLYCLPSGFSNLNGKVGGSFLEKTLPFVIQEGIHIVNASLGGFDDEVVRQEMQKAIEKGVVFTTSAGNKGKKGLGKFAKSNMWISIAAVGLNDRRKEIFLKNYSSKGPELDVVCFSGLYIHDAKNPSRVFPEEGTSFSAPMLAGMLALVQQFFLEKAGRTLYQDEVEKFIRDYVIDLGAEGFDEEYGHGLFVLPEPDEIEIERYLLRKGGDCVADYKKYLNLDLRSESNISARALDKYLEGTPMGGLGAYFIAAEKRYSVNAQYLCAHAVHESDFGRSRIARDKKNLFGFGAYDRNPYENAKSFSSFEECIYYVAEYIAENYLAPTGKYYNGPTLKGMNVKYATDPYWAEKIARHMAKIEEVAKNMKDYKGHWAEAAIEKVKAAGLMSGYPDGSFKPDQPVTRAELASVLIRILELEKVGVEK